MSLESLLGDSVDRAPISPQLPTLAPNSNCLSPLLLLLPCTAVLVVTIAWLRQRQCVPESFRSYLWVASVGDVCSVGKPALRFQGLGMRGELRP